MPYTPNFAAGDVLTAANMNSIGEAWTAFTPTWTALTTNPAMNNGTFDCRYMRINKLIIAHYRMVFGSTTTYGTGDWRLTLPVTSSTQNTLGDTIGWGFVFGDATYTPMIVRWDTATLLSLFYYAFNPVTYNAYILNVGQGAPYTFVNADLVNFQIVYEAA